MNRMPISMESDALSGMKRDFDFLITQAIGSMRAWHSQEYTINLKLTIKLSNALVDDGEGGFREAVVPVFEHKVTAVIQAKSELKGGTSDEYELMYDAELMRYCMVKKNSNQMSLFEEADTETGGKAE